MTFVIWNPAWETGIESIDDQHRQMLAQFESLLAAIHEDHAEDPIPGILVFLSHYVETHFSDEERQMQQSQYPGFQEHKAAHDEMRGRVDHLVRQYLESPAALTEDVIDFLTDWLIGHINGHDLRMARYLSRVNATALGAEP